MKLPRILITAMRSGAGKTMLTCGILKAMKMQEINPASFLSAGRITLINVPQDCDRHQQL